MAVIEENLGYDQTQMELFSKDQIDSNNQDGQAAYTDEQEINSKHGLRVLYLRKVVTKDDGNINFWGKPTTYGAHNDATIYDYCPNGGEPKLIRMDKPKKKIFL